MGTAQIPEFAPLKPKEKMVVKKDVKIFRVFPCKLNKTRRT
jgi:hypothetical protein